VIQRACAEGRSFARGAERVRLRLPVMTELAEIARSARTRWPDVVVDDETFAAYVAERTGEDGALPPCAVDLYLACACARGDAAALRHFNREVLARSDRVLARLGLSRADADDVMQEVRTRLLVGAAGEPGKLVSYQGTGPLAHWVSAVAGRQALGAMRRTRPTAEIDDDLLLDADDDPQLLVLKTRHRGEFKAAFQAAVAELEPRDRAVLRALVLDDRSVFEVAAVYGIHRVTASRWIAKIRATLLRGTRARLRASTELADRDLDSWIRDVDSGLELSLYRLLADGP
jgi:RNA polymerase sigma-70 factor, ECF subfamily